MSRNCKKLLYLYFVYTNVNFMFVLQCVKWERAMRRNGEGRSTQESISRLRIALKCWKESEGSKKSTHALSEWSQCWPRYSKSNKRGYLFCNNCESNLFHKALWLSQWWYIFSFNSGFQGTFKLRQLSFSHHDVNNTS